MGLSVPDARHHIHVIGKTGVGKSTWLAHHALGEAAAGRGVALIDVQGDLAQALLHRLPAAAADRLILLEPDDPAPPGWNPMHPHPGQHPHPAAASTDNDGADNDGTDDNGANGDGARGDGGSSSSGLANEWAAEGVVSVFRRSSGGWWGPRMDDLARAVCMTLIRRPGSTIADIPLFLTSPQFRRQVIAGHGEPPALTGYWAGYDELTPSSRAQLAGPLLARVRAVLARRYARDLLAVPRSSVDLGAVLDGAILIANLPKGALGDEVSRLVGSLLLTGLWAQATRRATRPPEHRPDATIILDEVHNLSHLPIGLADALAELRGYRVSLVLAHQHLGQLPPEIAHALAANARTKVVMTVSPEDARDLAPHFAPVFDDYDLAHRAPYAATIRAVHQGRDLTPFSVATLPLPPAVRGRAARLRAAARANAGVTRQQRRQQLDQLRRQLSVAAHHPHDRHRDRHRDRQWDRLSDRPWDWQRDPAGTGGDGWWS